MILLIAGGRDYRFTPQDTDLLNRLHTHTPITELVTGGAGGADRCAVRWASQHSISSLVFPPDWTTHGRAAGPMRNREMAAHLEAKRALGIPVAVLLFPGGKGTQSMRQIAERAGLPVFDIADLQITGEEDHSVLEPHWSAPSPSV